LPEAYRSLPRPSSAPDAKASTMCPKTLTNTRKQLKQKRYKSAILLRCSQPLSTNQTPHPTTKQGDNTVAHQPQQASRQHAGVVSGPNSVFSSLACPTKTNVLKKAIVVAHQTLTHYRCRAPHGSSET